jgi:hypothetical protein
MKKKHEHSVLSVQEGCAYSPLGREGGALIARTARMGKGDEGYGRPEEMQVDKKKSARVQCVSHLFKHKGAVDRFLQQGGLAATHAHSNQPPICLHGPSRDLV